MNDSILFAILRCSVFMLVSVVIAQQLFRYFSLRSASLRRTICVIIMLQGWCWGHVDWEIPWYSAPAAAPAHETSPSTAATNASTASPRATEPVSIAATTTTPEQPQPALRTPHDQTTSLPTTVLLIWCVGMLICGTVWLFGYLRFWSTTRSVTPCSDWQQEFDVIRQEMGIRQRIQLGVTRAVGPLLCLLPSGYRVLIPFGVWRGLPADQRRVILRHELAHFSNGDIWKQWAMFVLLLPQWFNPAAWWLLRHFRECGEWRCDDQAVDSAQERLSFAHALQTLVSSNHQQIVGAAQFREHPVMSRFQRLLTPFDREDCWMKKCFILCVASALLFSQVVQFKLVAQEGADVTVETVKQRMEQLDEKAEGIKETAQRLKAAQAELRADVEARLEELKKLSEQLDELGEDVQERVKLVKSGEEAKQLQALEGAEKLGDPGILLMGALAKDSAHATVRKAALKKIATSGQDALPAFAHAAESLSADELKFVVPMLAKDKSRKMMLVLQMISQRSGLFDDILALRKNYSDQVEFLVGMAREADDDRVERLIDEAAKLPEDDKLVLMYLVAKSSDSAKAKLKAMKIALPLGDKAFPIVAACFQSEDVEVRREVVKVLRDSKSPVAKFVLEKALSDPNSALREAAEEVLDEEQE